MSLFYSVLPSWVEGFSFKKSFISLFQAQIGGVWNVEENAGNYTCSHLAEVKTANVKTFENEEFYKRLVLSLDHLLKK